MKRNNILYIRQSEREVVHPLFLLIRQINKIYNDYLTSWDFVDSCWNPPLPLFVKVNFIATISVSDDKAKS